MLGLIGHETVSSFSLIFRKTAMMQVAKIPPVAAFTNTDYL